MAKELQDENLEEVEDELGDEVQADDLIAKLQEKLAQAEEEAKKSQDNYLRALAEMDNLRKRTQRDKEEYIKYANLPMVNKILPIIDDFERALNVEQGQESEGLHKGMELIFKKLLDLIEAEGVEAINAIGQPFDPEFHQPLLVEESEGPENIILEEMQKGYIMHGRVIRPSLVKVSK